MYFSQYCGALQLFNIGTDLLRMPVVAIRGVGRIALRRRVALRRRIVTALALVSAIIQTVSQSCRGKL